MSKQYAFNPNAVEDGRGAPRDGQTEVRKRFDEVRTWNDSGMNGVSRPVDPGTRVWDPEGLGRSVTIE